MIAEIQVLGIFIYTVLITVGVDKKQLFTVWKIADKGDEKGRKNSCQLFCNGYGFAAL